MYVKPHVVSEVFTNSQSYYVQPSQSVVQNYEYSSPAPSGWQREHGRWHRVGSVATTKRLRRRRRRRRRGRRRWRWRRRWWWGWGLYSGRLSCRRRRSRRGRRGRHDDGREHGRCRGRGGAVARGHRRLGEDRVGERDGARDAAGDGASGDVGPGGGGGVEVADQVRRLAGGGCQRCSSPRESKGHFG